MDDQAKTALCVPLNWQKDLLLNILDENIVGGFVINKFASLIQQSLDFTSNPKTAVDAADTLLLYAWQELNTGKWADVNVNWHRLYAGVSWLKALLSYRLSPRNPKIWEDVIKICDMGHLMGGDVWNGILIRTISGAERMLPAAAVSHEIVEPPSKKKRTNSTICEVYHAIPEITLPSLTDFMTLYQRKKIPVVLKSCLESWPALEKWSPEYVRAVCGSRTVPVELGKRYTDEDWGQELMTISSFIDNYIYMLDNPTKKIAYLAQHDLFTQAPVLRDDINTPDYVAFCGDDNPDISAWFGPEGTVSPLHFDPKDNLFCQVIGEKYVRLYEEAQTEYVYPHPAGMLFNTSQVDVENADLDKFPKFVNAKFTDYIMRPGDCLYIPARCWHFLRSLSISFSVSFWFSECDG